MRETTEDVPRAPVKAGCSKKRRVNKAADVTHDIFRCIQFDEEKESNYDNTCGDQGVPSSKMRRVTFANPLTEEIPAPEYHHKDTDSSSAS